LKNLESGKAEFGSAGEFLLEFKKEFGGENKTQKNRTRGKYDRRIHTRVLKNS